MKRSHRILLMAGVFLLTLTLIYYDTGLLYGQLGQIEAAKDNFRRYLALAPNARDAEGIRKSVGL